METLAIIVPCYNEQEALPLFYKEASKVLEKLDYDYKLLLINDGSKDNTLSIMKSIAEKDEHVKYLSFSRNFGKEAAMYAGFCNANADIVDGARDFRLMKREMVEAIVSMTEYNRFSKGIFGWIGFKTYWLSYDNIERVAGETKWNFWKLTKYAIDGIINFSQAPLSAVSGFGVLMTVVSFLMLVVVVGRKLIYGDPVAGWASTICVIIFIGGLQLFCLGVIGHYIAKMYLETKQRPHFIISETNDEDAVKLK